MRAHHSDHGGKGHLSPLCPPLLSTPRSSLRAYLASPSGSLPARGRQGRADCRCKPCSGGGGWGRDGMGLEATGNRSGAGASGGTRPAPPPHIRGRGPCRGRLPPSVAASFLPAGAASLRPCAPPLPAGGVGRRSGLGGDDGPGHCRAIVGGLREALCAAPV